ncbi:MAG: hypothetical protein ACP5I6_02755 [Caldisphaera sp.]|jgi:hypothetical protein|nr:MAG: hypothetical protein C0202_00375 [Caldisphaera sp.]PMP89170.1 MAG: hypothetical protein C0172_00940 [Caldisphaera sp.]
MSAEKRKEFMFEFIDRGYLMLPERKITRMSVGGGRGRYLLYLPENHGKIWEELWKKNAKVDVFIDVSSAVFKT